MGVTTDIIVGFPTETEDDFQATLEVMKLVKFQSSYSFMFSKRPGTVAATMTDEVAPDVALRRLQELQALQFDLSQEALQSWVGQVVEVLIDGPSKSEEELLQGRTSQNLTVNLEERYDWLSPGDIIPVYINGAARFTLKGVVSEGANKAREHQSL
jgi:tRNA-2-methylthio-N6-dimethylallyladenosine synthase